MPRTLQDIRDELLIIRCQDGEPDALEELIARWRARLHAHAWSLTGDAEAAADVSQESWCAIVKGIRRLSDPTSFGSWAYRIVTNKSADCVRVRQRRRSLEQRVIGEGVACSADEAGSGDRDDDDAARLRTGLALLEPDGRAILCMHYLGRMNVNQIAMALDIPVGTVKSRLYHARRNLRDAFERQTS